jgi:hypothetical protein
MSPAEAYAAACDAHEVARLARRAAIAAGRTADEWPAACEAFQLAFDVARAAGVELLDHAERPLSPHHR